MAHFLVLLPELLGLILSFDSVSHASLRLYLTGNRALQHQIRRGVTLVSLKERSNRFNRLPRFLTELSSLRVLRIEMAHHYLCEPEEVRYVLQHVSSSLEELCLEFCDASKVWDPPGDVNVSSLFIDEEDALAESNQGYLEPIFEDPIRNWSAKFPKLKSLSLLRGCSLLRPKDIDSLPPTLTELGYTVDCSPADFLDLLEAIPPNIVSLSFTIHCSLLIDSVSSIFSRLHSNIESFDLGWYGLQRRRLTEEDVLSLPPSLTHLPHFPSESIPPHLVSLLPVGLKTQSETLDMSQLSAQEVISTLEKISPSHLTFINLLEIEFTMDSDFISRLPRTSTKLGFERIDWTSITDNEIWPPSLTEINTLNRQGYPTGPITPAIGSILPRHLVILQLGEKIPLAGLKNLPRTLTHFKVRVNSSIPANEDQNMNFPPNLKSVLLRDEVDRTKKRYDEEMDGEARKEMFPADIIPQLPAGLETFSLDDATISQLEILHLPPALTSLDLLGFTERSDVIWSSQPPKARDRARELIRVGLASGLCTEADYEASHSMEKVGLFDLLPKTLTCLSIRGEGWITTFKEEHRVFGALPKNLISLSLPYTEMPIDSYKVLSRLREVNFRLYTLTDEHLMALPRSLTSVTISSTSCAATQDAVKYLPDRACFACIGPLPIVEWHHNEQRRKQTAFRNRGLLSQRCDPPSLPSKMED